MDTTLPDVFIAKEKNMNEKAMRMFVGSAIVILLITGLAKLVSSGGGAKLLSSTDPIFAISFRSLFQIVGTIELAVAFACFLSNNTALKLVLTAWIASSFVLYRLGLFALGHTQPCPCLGNLTDTIGLSPAIADRVMQVVMLYLLLGSCVLLKRQLPTRRVP